MRKIEKPAWLLFAVDVRVQLDSMPIRKSEKRFEQRELSTWQSARAYKGYLGSLEDWKFLLRRLGRTPHRPKSSPSQKKSSKH
jgi:hypothetical protein